MRAGPTSDRSPGDDWSLLIPAAGQGERLGRGPKAFLEWGGKPLVAWVAEKAARVASEVIIAVPAGQLEALRALCPTCHGLVGGATRQETMSLLVAASTKPWLLVQDVARPFVSERLLRAVAAAARETGAAGAFLHPDVPIARIENGFVREDFKPAQVGIFQAPQGFNRELLMRVLAEAADKGWVEQSTLQLVLRAGHSVRAVPGEKTNLKLTTEEDIIIAESMKEWLV